MRTYFYVICWNLRDPAGALFNCHYEGLIRFRCSDSARARYLFIRRTASIPEDAVITSYHCERS